ncbi:MAG: ATP-grasp domain-containing protein [Chloroflexota bacterium]|nr:ATP-grasp domain-containing protein [Chloroflexota bacterium]
MSSRKSWQAFDPFLRILIVGLSTRAIAESAARGGHQIVTLDYFGDRDQRALVDNYALQRDFNLPFTPEALAKASRWLDVEAVAYTSNLENHTEIVQDLAQGRILLGNEPSTLRRVRDWRTLRAFCRQADIPFPTTLLPGEEGAADPSVGWLRKPIRSGGGGGIHPWDGDPLDDDHLLQVTVHGRPASAAFAADGERSVVLGLTEQLVGREELGAEGYAWCGNIVPLTLGSGEDVRTVLHQVERTVERLTRRFSLRGVNGIDLVVAQGPAGRPRPTLVEVNPRYTASMELVERAYGLSVFDLHVRACEGELPAFSLEERLAEDRLYGKGIVYAEEDVVVPNTSAWRRQGRRDVPFSREGIGAGHPICTVMAEGETREACWQALLAKADVVRQTLIPSQHWEGP